MRKPILLLRSSSVLFSALLLSACASTPADNPTAQMEQQLNERYPGAQLSAPVPVIANKKLDLQSAIQMLLSQSPQVRIQLLIYLSPLPAGLSPSYLP